jgi:hypothetical protein
MAPVAPDFPSSRTFPLATRAHPQGEGILASGFRSDHGGDEASMANEDDRIEEAEEVLKEEPSEDEPWAKTSSGDADNITDDDS